MRKLLLPVVLALLVSSQGLALPKKGPRTPPPPRPAVARFVPPTSIWTQIRSFFRRLRPACDEHTQPPPCPGIPSSGG